MTMYWYRSIANALKSKFEMFGEGTLSLCNHIQSLLFHYSDDNYRPQIVLAVQIQVFGFTYMNLLVWLLSSIIASDFTFIGPGPGTNFWFLDIFFWYTKNINGQNRIGQDPRSAFEGIGTQHSSYVLSRMVSDLAEFYFVFLLAIVSTSYLYLQYTAYCQRFGFYRKANKLCNRYV